MSKSKTMESKRGKIAKKEVDEGINKNGNPYKRWIFEMEDGKKYSTFDETIGEGGFQVGDFVEMSGEQKGKYWNMSTMQKADPNTVQEEKSDESGSQEPQQSSGQEADILRQILAELKMINANLEAENGNTTNEKAEN